MKLNPFRQPAPTTAVAPPKSSSSAPVHRPTAPPPRVWSLLLPPGFSRDRE